MPNPTPVDPFCQLKWLFDRCQSLQRSDSAKSKYPSAYKFFVSALELAGHRGPYHLSKHINEFSLFNFYTHTHESFNSKNYLQSTVGVIRKVLNFARRENYVNCEPFIEVSISKRTRVTESFTAYSEAQLTLVREALRPHLDLSRSASRKYTLSGVGVDPRIQHSSKASGRHEASVGWANRDNAIWYYENVVLQENRASALVGESMREFESNVIRFHGDVDEFLASIGALNTPNLDVIVPPMARLLDLTGVNQESMRELPLSPMRRHPLTNVWLLYYYKERSTGDKELPLPLLNDYVASAGDLILTCDQPKDHAAVQINRMIELLQTLTFQIRCKLPLNDPLRQKLFLHQTNGKIRGLTVQDTQHWIARLKKKSAHILKENGKSFSVNMARFRPAVITGLLKSGKDIEEVREVSGHADSKTLEGYAADQSYDFSSSKKVADQMKIIWLNAREARERTQEFDDSGEEVKSTTTFKGLMSDCKNVFNPPAEIRKALNLKKGASCPRMNMCILCNNVVIFRHHLPLIANYRLQLNDRLSNDAMDLPNRHLYESMRDIVNRILDPSTGEFSPKEIQSAIDQALENDTFIDPAIYRSVE